LAKEIQELKDVPVKYLDEECLHRNEKTFEVEGVKKGEEQNIVTSRSARSNLSPRDNVSVVSPRTVNFSGEFSKKVATK
jgi:hypothetical protein